MTIKISVIGAGINGLGTAYCLAQQFSDSNITITSSEWHPDTTSDHGLGIVMLRTTSITDNCCCLKYVLETLNYCQRMESSAAEEAGIRLTETIFACNEYDDKSRQDGLNAMQTGIDVRLLSREETKKLGITAQNTTLLFDEHPVSENTLKCYAGKYYVIDTARYLPWLKRKLESLSSRDGKKRVHFITKKVSHFSEIEPCDLIVNCSGLGGKDLAGDDFVIPIRGQYLSLDAPTIKRMCIINHSFIVPRFDDVAVGSMYQVGRTEKHINSNDTEYILKCAQVGCPAIRDFKIRKIDVGIRPGRIGGPRVELDIMNGTTIIHNYGHGPRGIAQHWGCALKVKDLAEAVLSKKSKM